MPDIKYIFKAIYSFKVFKVEVGCPPRNEILGKPLPSAFKWL